MTTIEAPRVRDARHHRQAITSLDALAAELVRQQDSKHDLVVDTRRVGWTTEMDGQTYVTVDGAEQDAPWHTITVGTEEDSHGMPVQGWKVNDHTHGQIATALEIPGRYYKRLRSEAPDLLDTNVRHWFTEKPKRRMLRTLDGRVRAYVSDRYQRRDNFDLLEALLPVFSEIDDLTFHVSALTDTNLYLRAIVPGIARTIKVGDVAQCGIEIKNSEVGAGQLEVSPYVWRLVCLNGMIMPRAIGVRHVGRRIEEDDVNAAFYSAATLSLDDRAFFAKVTDVVRGTLTETRFEQITRPMVEAAGGPLIDDVPAAVEHLAKTFGVTEEERGSILRNLTAGGDLTQWGLANAVTAAAKEADSFDRLREMEAIGGALIASV